MVWDGKVAPGLQRNERAVRQLCYELEIIGQLGFGGTSCPWPTSRTPWRWGSGLPPVAPAPAPWSPPLFVAMANPFEHRLLFERFRSERRMSSVPHLACCLAGSPRRSRSMQV